MEGSEVTPLAERFNQVDNARTTTTGPARIRVGSPPRLPSVERDIAVLVAADRPAGEVDAAEKVG